MNQSIRILAGTVRPGGATCLFPVIRELRSREGVDVRTIAHSHAADVFGREGIDFVDLGRDDSAAVTQSAVRDAVRQYEPDVILTGVFGPIEGGLDHWLIRASQNLGIPSAGVLDAWMNYAMRFADPLTGDPGAFLPDRLAVMDAQTVIELADEGIPTDRVIVTGHPFLPIVRQRSQDKAGRQRVRDSLGAGGGERVIVFFSEPLRWGMEQGLNDPIGYDEFEAFGLLRAALGRSRQPGVLVVREHPRHKSLDWPRRIGASRVVEGDDCDMMGLICAADIVAGMSSTVLVYAHLMGLRVVVIQPSVDPRRDCNMLTRRGILPNRQTSQAVADAFDEVSVDDAETLRRVRADLGWETRPDVRVADCVLELCIEAASGRT